MKRNTGLWVPAGKALREALWPDATIATTSAGAIPYYSRLRTIDQSGLNDRHTAKVEWRPWHPSVPGHGRLATDSYVLSRKPDLILAHPWIDSGSGSVRPRMPHPWEGYVLRALPIPGLEDEQGASLYLYFVLRSDLAARGEEHGFLDPAVPGWDAAASSASRG